MWLQPHGMMGKRNIKCHISKNMYKKMVKLSGHSLHLVSASFNFIAIESTIEKEYFVYKSVCADVKMAAMFAKHNISVHPSS